MIGKIISTNKHLAEVRLGDYLQAKSSKMHCGICFLFSKKNQDNENIVFAQNNINAKPGDDVEIELENWAILKSTFILLLFPLIIFLFTSWLLEKFEVSSILVFLGGLFSASVIYFLEWIFFKNKSYYKIVNFRKAKYD